MIPKPQTITFNAIPAQTVGAPLTLSASATSGLPVTFASQAGNGTTYAAAPSVTQSFTVNGKSQTIAFQAIPSQVQGTPLSLSATAASGLPVTFTSTTPAVCNVSSVTATLVSAGTCTIVASQAGNSTYAAATPVSESFTVIAAFTITPQPNSETVFADNIAAFLLQLQAATGLNGNVTLSCASSVSGSYCVDFPMTVSFHQGQALALSGIFVPLNTPPGTYTITFTGVSGTIKNSATATFTVKKL